LIFLKTAFCYQKAIAKTQNNPSFSIYVISFQIVNLVRQALMQALMKKWNAIISCGFWKPGTGRSGVITVPLQP